jgi:pimeloyl-ACP methyl ester carboxylesterase
MTGEPREVVFKGASGNDLIADAWGEEAGNSSSYYMAAVRPVMPGVAPAARVAAAGWYTLSVDLRGHGESDWTESYSHVEFGRDVIEVVRQIGARPVLVGASLGGISALFAEDVADGGLCSSLVLVDVAPQTNPEGVERILSFMKAGAGGFASVDDAADAVAGYLRERKRPGEVSGLKKNLRRRKSDGRWYWHWDPRFLDHPPETGHGISPNSRLRHGGCVFQHSWSGEVPAMSSLSRASSHFRSACLTRAMWIPQVPVTWWQVIGTGR